MAKRPCDRYISGMKNSKTDIAEDERAFDGSFEPHKRLLLCVLLLEIDRLREEREIERRGEAPLSVCECASVGVAVHLLCVQRWGLLTKCAFSIQHNSARCKAVQAAWLMSPQRSLMPLVGWSQNTPGSPSLISWNPGGDVEAGSEAVMGREDGGHHM